MKQDRRRFLRFAAAATATFALGSLPLARAATDKLKIGVIGSGRIGSTLGGLWVKAGHEVMFSSLDIEHDKALARVMTAVLKDDTELFKQFMDNQSFRRWLTDTVFGITYDRPTG